MKTTRNAASAATHYTIAIVEEDEATGESIATWIRELGHTAIRFGSGTDLLKTAGTVEFAAFLVDWGLRDTEGIDLLRDLRSCGRAEAPVILCAARGGEADVVEALRLGADDFIVKPVRRYELSARVGAALRRAFPQPADTAILAVPPFSIDLANRVFYVDRQMIELQNREYALALLLFQNLNGVVPRTRIIQSLWGGEPRDTSRSLDTHICRIRRKLGLSAERGLILQSVYGIGYRLRIAAISPPEES
jgi:DNA-binding response OmpR family regulator